MNRPIRNGTNRRRVRSRFTGCLALPEGITVDEVSSSVNVTIMWGNVGVRARGYQESIAMRVGIPTPMLMPSGRSLTKLIDGNPGRAGAFLRGDLGVG